MDKTTDDAPIERFSKFTTSTNNPFDWDNFPIDKSLEYILVVYTINNTDGEQFVYLSEKMTPCEKIVTGARFKLENEKYDVNLLYRCDRAENVPVFASLELVDTKICLHRQSVVKNAEGKWIWSSSLHDENFFEPEDTDFDSTKHRVNVVVHVIERKKE